MVVHSQFSAQTICENLVTQIKRSNLNFILSETPYSVNISLRKRFLKEINPNNSSPPLFDHVAFPHNAPEISPVIEMYKIDQKI